MPLPAGVTGRASASYAMGAGDVSSAAGSIGLGWTLFGKLEFTADAGVAGNGAWSTSPAPGRQHLLPLVGGAGPQSTSTADHTVGATLEIGAKVLFP